MSTVLNKAKELRDALDVSIAMMESGQVTEADVALVDEDQPVFIEVHQPSLVVPTAHKLAAIGDSTQAREKVIAESGRKRAAAITLQVSAQLISLLSPLAGQLIRRGVGVVLLLLILLAPACSAQVGSDSEPVVQVGSTSQPMATVSVEAPVDATVHVASPHATLTGSADLHGIGSDTTAQTASQANTSSAGGDNRPVAIVATFSGSGWPMVVVAFSAVVIWIFYVMNTRQAKKIDQREDEYDTLERNAVGVAKAIYDIGPGPVRDKLLARIRANVKDGEEWDATIGAWHVSSGE
jgi:hypothetical protein